MSSIARRAGTVLLWLVLAVVVVLASLMVLVPRVTGWVPLTILTGSMEPTIPTGSQVVVQTIDGEADASKLNVGDVVTFMPYPDDPKLVTHRIVSRTLSSDGGISFETQGDANNAADSWTLTATQLRGVVQYHVPYAGYLATALDGNQKQTGVGVAAAALLAYAVAQFLGALRERRTFAPAIAADSEPFTAGPAGVAVPEDAQPTRAASTKHDTAARTHGPRHRRDQPGRDRELVDAA
ncbi:signal peptidase I [Georgenia yuyongxinii]|nr:signal peptidase I [Georgenia yuyongxinii]